MPVSELVQDDQRNNVQGCLFSRLLVIHELRYETPISMKINKLAVAALTLTSTGLTPQSWP